MTRVIVTSPLTREAFAPFGQVLDIDGADYHPINGGTTQRFDLAQVDVTGPAPRARISIARGQPYDLPLTLAFVERHPLGSQAFMPLSRRPFLVTVAPDENGRPGTPRSFLTRPGQGINFARNTWHGVLTPLGEVSDFFVVDRAGDEPNLEVFTYPEPWLIELG